MTNSAADWRRGCPAPRGNATQEAAGRSRRQRQSIPVILGVVDRWLWAVGSEAFDGVIAHPDNKFSHQDGEEHGDESTVHGPGRFARMTGGRDIVGPEHGEKSLEGAG